MIPSVAPPRQEYLERRRNENAFVPRFFGAAPEPQQVLRDADQEEVRYSDELRYSDEDLFAPGDAPNCFSDWLHACGDCLVICCSTRYNHSSSSKLEAVETESWLAGESQPYFISFCLYFCCSVGNDVGGRFIWPTACPCGCITCCCPLSGLGASGHDGVCDAGCVCCRSSAQRLDSVRYWTQRVMVASSEKVIETYPLPTDPTLDPPYPSPGPTDFARKIEAMANYLVSIPCIFPFCIRYQTGCCGLCTRAGFAPDATYMPASSALGSADKLMHAGECGGYWAFPKAFKNAAGEQLRGRLPTPPGARDDNGRPFETNVAVGKPGSKVIFWAHGSGWIATQSAVYLWLIALFLCQQTGHVVLVGEYPLASSTSGNVGFYPTQLAQWVRTYANLVRVYGPENVILGGDSAGGGLAMSTLLCALSPERLIASPAGMLLISPFVDLSDGSSDKEHVSSMAANAPRENGGLANYGLADILPHNGYQEVCAVYASAETRNTEPLCSPGLHNKKTLKPYWRDWPTTFIAWGDQEILRDQISATAAAPPGGLVTTHVVERGFHISPIVGLPLVENLGCCGGSDPQHSEVARAWYVILSWLRDTVGWKETRVPEEWRPAVYRTTTS